MKDCTDGQENQADISKVYAILKCLLKKHKYVAAKNFMVQHSVLEYWPSLLKLSMLKNNCPVTKLILNFVIRSGARSLSDIQDHVSKVDHEISIDFAQRVQNYVNSKEFKKSSAKRDKGFHYFVENNHAVRQAAQKQLMARAGLGIKDPKSFGR